MNIETKVDNGEVVICVSGCLDTAATAEFQQTVDGLASETKNVTFDFAGLEFIASSALRVMVTLCKRLNASAGRITVKGANDVVRDVFEMTGLVEVFTVL